MIRKRVWSVGAVAFVYTQCPHVYTLGSMELLQVPTSSDGFAPFPSQMFAMMYLIVHSPRPMVRRSIAETLVANNEAFN